MSLEPIFEYIYRDPVVAALWLLCITLINAQTFVKVLNWVLRLVMPEKVKLGLSALILIVAAVLMLGFITSGLKLSHQYTEWG